jgi:exodeoxyribonuclease V alpha subunit
MITHNHYPLGLYNGDIGLTWPDAQGRLKVWFEGEGGALRDISPQQLPRHQTVFAMTVHKSQGSEFDHTLLVLPERDTPVLTRELVYTGCTRARRGLTLMAREEMIGVALDRTIQRTSGLVDALHS